MLSSNKISTKIKVLGAVLIVLMLGIIAITIFLNQKNVKDALIINVAGKERMLTQKIAKNIFYLQLNPNHSQEELTLACVEFEEALHALRFGNKNRELIAISMPSATQKLESIEKLWEGFDQDIVSFREVLATNKDKDTLSEIANKIFVQNEILLQNVDEFVSNYTHYSEEKTNFIKSFQYGSAVVLLILFIYSLMQLKSIESHVDSFMQYSKQLVQNENLTDIKPIELLSESEDEIVEVSGAINTFIQKLNSAMEDSNEAIELSNNASLKLEELTVEFDNILHELENSSIAAKYLNSSEDIVIESTESLIYSAKKLQNLKNELENLAKSCQIIKKD